MSEKEILELEGGKEETPPEKREKKSSRITCEFCECVLLPTGEHTGLSSKAKQLRDSESTIGKLNDKVTALTSENEALKSELTSLRNPTEKKDKKWGVFKT